MIILSLGKIVIQNTKHICQMKNNINDIQSLFLTWMSNRGPCSYEIIKECCEYLNCEYELYLNKPINFIFYPLFRTGVIDYAGDNQYCTTPTFMVTNGDKTIVTNTLIEYQRTTFAGISVKKYEDSDDAHKFNALYVLTNFPSIKQIVDAFEHSFETINKQDNKFSKSGIVTLNGIQLQKYLYLKNDEILLRIPSRIENPEALNLSCNYSRVIRGWNNGIYNKKSHILKLKKYGSSIMLYRILFIESLLSEVEPIE